MDLILLKILLILIMACVSLFFGLLPLKIHSWLEKKSVIHRQVTSMLSCFAGGVILGVCLLDMFPEASEQLEDLQELTHWKSDFPYLYLLIGLGFFIVYFVDMLCDHYFDFEEVVQRKLTVVRNDTNKDQAVIPRFIRANSAVTDVPVFINEQIWKRRAAHKAISTCFTLVAGLAVHKILEGFAFGIQQTQISLTSLFFGIIFHEALVIFSVGMSLTQKLAKHSICALIFFIVLLSLFSSMGAIVGMIVEGSLPKTASKSIIVTALMCFSIGCFLFVGFFEILCVERAKKTMPVLQFLSCFLGFIVTSVMMFVPNM
uniref:Zinc transporter ZIP3 n=1 Tax=Panagrolaimus sp. JU765 TaxID=591449 RepID=A0AC34QGC6_9BILA